MTVSVVVSGADGRLGRRILAQCVGASDIAVRGAVVRPDSPVDGRDASVLCAELTETGLRATGAMILEPGAVLIETAPPKAALRHAEQAAGARMPVVIATTGFSAAEVDELKMFAEAVPVLLAPNLSLGVTVLTELVERASAALSAYDVEIVDLHHRRKRDAPSGTAWALARAADAARGREADRDVIAARSGEVGPRSDTEIGVFAVRGGDIIGEHTVYFAGETERVELTHRAINRDAFAHGAVQAARFLSLQAQGWFTMRDVVGL